MIKNLILIIGLIFISGCSEKTIYIGKIPEEINNFDEISNKDELTNILGQPSYIDPIENKFYYFSEKKLYKNFFDEKIIDRTIYMFKFDNTNKIISKDNYSLVDQTNIEITKEQTKNNIVERGIIEKIFGGVGIKNMATNTSQE